MNTLNTHKGTVVRAIINFVNGERQFIEPLSDGIGGVVLDCSKFRQCSSLKLTVTGSQLVTDDGGVLLSITNPIQSFEAFVIYPDGTTWQGSIGKDLNNPFAFLWADSLIQSMVDRRIVEDFYGDFCWKNIPTTLILYGDLNSAFSCTTQHACGKQCE